MIRAVTAPPWLLLFTGTSTHMADRQKHRRAEAPLEPLQRAGSSRAGGSELWPGMFWIPPRMETSQPLWATSSNVHSPSDEKKIIIKINIIYIYILCLSSISCMSICSHCLLSFHCVPLIRVWLHLLYIPSLPQVKCTWLRAPWAFSLPGWTVPALSASPSISHAPIHQLHGPSLDSL